MNLVGVSLGRHDIRNALATEVTSCSLERYFSSPTLVHTQNEDRPKF